MYASPQSISAHLVYKEECFEASKVNIRNDGLMVCVVGSRWILGYHGVLLQEVTQKSLRILDIVIIISILSVQQVNAI